MHGNLEMRLFSALGLALIDGQDSIMDVLPSHLDDIAAALPGVQ
jgi:hypothetical protein